MADRDLAGMTAVVTGSGRNIGRAIALEFASCGANVIVNSRSNDVEAESVATEVRAYGVAAEVVLGDATRQQTIDTLLDVAVRRFGGVDISVSNAAVRPHQSFEEITDDDWNDVMVQQLTASFCLARAFAPGMRDKGWGRIIHVVGPSFFLGLANRAHSVTAKGALRAFTKALALELGPFGITVNDLAPGAIATVNNERSHPRATERDGSEVDDRSWAIPGIPVGRLGTPEDVAYAAGFLASPRASYYTGTAMCCFGGQWNVP